MAENGSMQKTAAQAYLEVAVDHGVDYIFGLPGTSGQEFIGHDCRSGESPLRARAARDLRGFHGGWLRASHRPAVDCASEHAAGFVQRRGRALRRLSRSFAGDRDLDPGGHAHHRP